MGSRIYFELNDHSSIHYKDSDKYGIIQLFDNIDVESLLQKSEGIEYDEKTESQRFQQLCIVDVPAHMIPSEILNFLKPNICQIASISVFRHCGTEKYLAIITLQSIDYARQFIQDYFGELLSSLDHTCCVVYPINYISYPKWLSNLHKNRQHLSSSSRSSPLLFSSNDRKETLSPTLFCEEGDDPCPLCLEIILPTTSPYSNSFTTCCNHRFHIQCIAKLEGPQCPVCRFQHDEAPLSYSECMVCGYGHNSFLFNNFTGPYKATVDDAYGDNNHSINGQFSNMYNNINSKVAYNNADIPSSSSRMTDLWICLLCGFTGCGNRGGGGHIQAHYEETLHTYAMHTTSRQVWDFSGDGYVHRLLLHSSTATSESAAAEEDEEEATTASSSTSIRNNNKSSSSSEDRRDDCSITGQGSSNSRSNCDNMTTTITSPFGAGNSHSKLVEVPPLHYPYDVRDQRVPLSDQEEETLVSSKLEAAAYRYNQLLSWQLQQNRLLYETRLQRIRNSVIVSNVGDTSETASSSSSSSIAVRGKNWRDSIIISLKSEKNKLQRQLEAAKERLQRSHRELRVLQDLGSSLEQNQLEWTRRVEAANETLTEAEQAYRLHVPALEEKVNILMARLDAASRIDTGQRGDSTDYNVNDDSNTEMPHNPH